MPGTRFQKTLYWLCAILATAHLAFAAIAVSKDQQIFDLGKDILDDYGVKSGSTKNAIDRNSHASMGTGIFRCVIAALCMIYFFSHLLARHLTPSAWFVSNAADWVSITVLFVLTIVSEVISIVISTNWWNTVDILIWAVRLLVFLILIIFEIVFIVRKKKLFRLTFGEAMKASADNLKDGRLGGYEVAKFTI